MKRGLKGIHIYGCRCNEGLKAKTEGSARLGYTGLRWARGHLKIETMLRGKRFESVRGECDLEAVGVPSIFKLVHNAGALARIFPNSGFEL